MARAALLAVALMAATLPAGAAEPFRDFLSEQKTIWTSPLHLESSQAPWLAMFGAGAAALIAADVRISAALPQSGSTVRWGERFSRSGSPYGVLALGGAVWAVGAGRHDSKQKQAGLAAAEAAVHSFAVTYGLKWIAARERPNTGAGRGHFWSGFDRAPAGDNSFPSGHSMEAWAAATVIARQYSRHRYVPWLAYGFAAMVSGSRVAAQRHYVSDVAVGACAGYLIGKLVEKRYERTRRASVARLGLIEVLQ